MAQRKKSSKKSSRSRIPVTLDRVKILRHFGPVKTEPVDPQLVARLLAIQQMDPDRDHDPMTTGLFILSGVASTLDTMGAPLLGGENDDERRHGEALWFLSKSIHRAIAFIHGDLLGGNTAASAYQIIRPDHRRKSA